LRLHKLSIAIIVCCALGLGALLAVGYFVLQDIRTQRADAAELLTLQGRLTSLAMASESLLYFASEPLLWESVRKEAAQLSEELETVDRRHPGAARLARYIDLMMRLLEEEYQVASSADGMADADGALGLSQRSRNILVQLAGHDMALHSAMTSLLEETHQRLAERSYRAVALLAAIAAVFGLLCILAFFIIHRRVTTPITRMVSVIARLGDGDDSARVNVRGRDEMAELGRTFDQLLDHQHESRVALKRYEQALEERARLLSESQRIAGIASFKLHLSNDRLDWIGESPRVLGLSCETFPESLDAFLELIHPEDQESWLECRSKALKGETPSDMEFRLLNGGSSARIVHQRAELEEPDTDGCEPRLIATIQDVSESQALSEHARFQKQLLDTAGRVARFGGWSVDIRTDSVYWSDLVCDIHDMPRGTLVSLDEGLDFYAPEYRDRVSLLVQRCLDEGEPFDFECEILTARDERRWVRAIGEPVFDRSGALIRIQGALQDITASKQADERLHRISSELRTTLDNITEGFFTLTRDWRFSYINSEAVRHMERSHDELLGQNIWELFPELGYGVVAEAYQEVLRSGKPARINEYFYPPLDAWFDIRIYPTRNGLAVFFTDVSERREMLEKLRQQEADLRQSHDQLAAMLDTRQVLVNSLPAHIALLSADGTIIDVNEHWRRFGRENDFRDEQFGVGTNYLDVCGQVSGQEKSDAIQFAEGLRGVLAGSRQSFSLEYPCHSPSVERWFRGTVNRLSEGDESHADLGAVVMHVDITERKQAEEHLNRLAFEDPLTGALSRNGFTRALSDVIESDHWDKQGMVIMLDLINLSHVNDAHGYEVGDKLLAQVRERLDVSVGEGGLVGRAGGDEFMVFLPSKTGLPKATRRKQIARVFSRPFEIDGFPIEIFARFGYTQLRTTRRPVERLLREAELALFEGTSRGSANNWSTYTERLDRSTRDRIELTREIALALERDEFELLYQPKVDMRTGQLLAAEALIRWNHPQRGVVSPDRFIPVAEQSQLIGPIGDWVVNAACRALAEWSQAGLNAGRVSVNVSLSQFSLGNFSRTVKKALKVNGVSAHALSLEITESVFEREDLGLLDHMNTLSRAGIQLSLDDFGTGYSSLMYLQKYPFDEIKVDRGFVSQMLDDRYSREIVRTVIGVAGVIGARVVAEGVETAAERDALLAMGCHIGQGYYYSRPLSAKAFRSLLESRANLPT